MLSQKHAQAVHAQAHIASEKPWWSDQALAKRQMGSRVGSSSGSRPEIVKYELGGDGNLQVRLLPM